MYGVAPFLKSHSQPTNLFILYYEISSFSITAEHEFCHYLFIYLLRLYGIRGTRKLLLLRESVTN